MLEERIFKVHATHIVETEVSIQARTPEEAESIYESDYGTLPHPSITDTGYIDSIEALPEDDR